MDWFRMKSGFRHNAKVQLLSDKLFRCYVNLLCLANEGTPRGVLPTVEEIAYDLRLTVEEAGSVLDELTQRGLIDRVRGGKMMPHNWSQHQRVWDDVADRQRQYRNRKAAPGAALKGSGDAEPLHNVLRNGDATSDVQNRTEQNRTDIPPIVPPGDSAVLPPKRATGHRSGTVEDRAFEEAWKMYPKRVGKDATYRGWVRRVKEGYSPEELKDAVKRYAAKVTRDRTEDRYIKHGQGFFGNDAIFKDYLGPAEQPQSLLGWIPEEPFESGGNH